MRARQSVARAGPPDRPWARWSAAGRAVLFVLLVSAAFGLSGGFGPARAAAPPATCRIGAYVTDLYGLAVS